MKNKKLSFSKGTLFLLLLGIILSFISLNSAYTNYRLISADIKVNGRVIGEYEYERKKTYPVIEYFYQGKFHRGAGPTTLPRLRIGDQTMLFIDPNDPKTFMTDRLWHQIQFPIGTALFALGCFGFIAYQRKNVLNSQE